MLGPHGWGSEEQQPYPNLDMWQWQREPVMDYVVASDKHCGLLCKIGNCSVIIPLVCYFWARGPIPSVLSRRSLPDRSAVLGGMFAHCSLSRGATLQNASRSWYFVLISIYPTSLAVTPDVQARFKLSPNPPIIRDAHHLKNHNLDS